MAGARGSARRQLVARVFGPRNRRRGARSSARWRQAVLGLAVALAVAVGAASWPPVRDAVRRHPYFAVREVVVRGARRLAAAEVRAAAGLEPGMSVWDVDAGATEARLRRHPWIRTARVRRELPSRVIIDVREEHAAAIVVLGERQGREYYVSPRARLLTAVAPGEARDVPYVTGLAPADLAEGEAFGPRALRRALALARRRGPEVSEVHIDRDRGLTLMPVKPAVPIELGWGRFDEKLARLARVLPLWAGREAQIAAVSCVFDDELIVRTRVTAGTVPPRRAGRS